MGDTLTFSYVFILGDGRKKEFNVRTDGSTMNQIVSGDGPAPDWTALTFHQCSNCPLDATAFPQCPAALSLVDVVDFFHDDISYDEADVFIEAPVRNYSRHISLQEGISSLVGLLMATSGCPHLEKLKPMARFHLPFADDYETTYRNLSMYLLAQYFISREGGSPDWELKGLVGLYDDIRTVNKHFVQRLTNIQVKDASLNALVKLDCFAMSIDFTVNQGMIDDYREMFGPFLKG
jgi:hypothetical protein